MHTLALLMGSTALVLGSIAALWWAVGRTRADRDALAFDRAAFAQSSERRRRREAEEQRHAATLRTVLPVAAGLLGAVAGWAFERRKEMHLPPTYPMPTPWPIDPPAPGAAKVDDETEVELDLESLLASAMDAGLGEVLSVFLHKAKATRDHGVADDLEPPTCEATPS